MAVVQPTDCWFRYTFFSRKFALAPKNGLSMLLGLRIVGADWQVAM